MSQKSQLIIYIMLIIVVFITLFIVWAIDTGRLASSADTNEITTYSATELMTLPAPDQSTFGELFGKVASWFGR